MVKVDRRFVTGRRQRNLAGKLFQPAGSEQAATREKPVHVRHSLRDSIQLQLRSAVWAWTHAAGEHAAVGRCDHRRMEDERHLAHRRWTALDLHCFRWESNPDLWWTAPEHRWHSPAQPR